MKKQTTKPHFSEASQKELKVAAHDINNLLNNILNGVELLKEKLNDDVLSQTLVNHIEKNTLLATEIVQQISYSDSNAVYKKAELNLFQIINDTIELFEKKSNESIKIEFDFSDKHYPIWGNYIDIKRVLLNLIINAQEAIRDKPKVKVKIEDIKESIKISVSDNGPGISQKIVNHIFEEGFSTKSEKSKSGLGLSIVKNIVQNHSGRIEVISNEAIGTTFELYFPIYYNDKKNKQFEKKKVLIAEDDEFQREVLKDLLIAMKINVFTASNGIDALDLYMSTKPDLMFIDETMPGMTGIECTEKIRETDKVSQIVLVTGSNIDENSLNNKISKVLKKPYNFEMVRSTLNELL